MSAAVVDDLLIADSRTTSRTREAQFAYRRLSSERIAGSALRCAEEGTSRFVGPCARYINGDPSIRQSR
jgi:hypothetical protein